MTTPQQTSPLDAYRSTVVDLLDKGFCYQEIADAISAIHLVPTTRHSVRRAVKRWGLRRPANVEPASVEQDEDDLTVVSKPGVVLSDTDEMLRERGYDPDEWEVVSLTLNEWDSPTGETLKQQKASFKKVVFPNWILPARPRGWERPASLSTSTIKHVDKARLVVFVGDQQAPYQDPRLHQLFCEWLEYNKPHRGVLMGDTVDFPTISRHPDKPNVDATVMECLNSAYGMLTDYVQSSQETSWRKLYGNHDERISVAIAAHNQGLWNLRRADKPGGPELPVWSLTHLLRLDELGIEAEEPQAGYEFEQIKISSHLAARHGWLVTKGSGTSALKTLEHLRYSLVIGHTHRRSLVSQTKEDIDGNPYEITVAETGCMCLIKGGLHYTVGPDWQNGFTTATVWPDGTFKLDNANYVGGKLLWRDQRYS